MGNTRSAWPRSSPWCFLAESQLVLLGHADRPRCLSFPGANYGPMWFVCAPDAMTSCCLSLWCLKCFPYRGISLTECFFTNSRLPRTAFGVDLYDLLLFSWPTDSPAPCCSGLVSNVVSFNFSWQVLNESIVPLMLTTLFHGS